jgi:type IV secretion system protein VirB1
VRGAPADILKAIIRTESGYNPLAINVNRGFRLARQPSSRKEAEAWARWLFENGCNFDSGLMQINSGNWRGLGLTPESVFDTCENIRTGAKIFLENHNRAAAAFGPGPQALVAALSAYNTGDFNSGFRNGYVSRVVQHVRIEVASGMKGIPLPIAVDRGSHGPANPKRKRSGAGEHGSEMDPFTAPSTLTGFMPEDLKPWQVK